MAKRFADRPPLPSVRNRNRYVLDHALAKTNEAFEKSTAAIPGEAIDDAAWGKNRRPAGENAHHNLVERINRERRYRDQPELLSTTYYREELYPGEKGDRRKELYPGEKKDRYRPTWGARRTSGPFDPST
jgi:hypothetical protein